MHIAFVSSLFSYNNEFCTFRFFIYSSVIKSGKKYFKLFKSLHWLFVICIIGLSIEFQFVGEFRQYDGISMKFVVYCWIECRNVVYWNERRECVCLCLNTYPCISLFNQTEATCKDELLAQYQNQTSTSEYKTIFVDIHTLWFCSLCDQSFFYLKRWIEKIH